MNVAMRKRRWISSNRRTIFLHSTTRQGKLVVLHASLSMINSGGSSSSHHGARIQVKAVAVHAPQERQESLSHLPQAVAVEILSPPRNLTFEDYARKQCSLELCVAVDFTRANGKAFCLFVAIHLHWIVTRHLYPVLHACMIPIPR